jgi:hypothetical protein
MLVPLVEMPLPSDGSCRGRDLDTILMAAGQFTDWEYLGEVGK